MKKLIIISTLLLVTLGISCAQGTLIKPESSQKAGVTQRIGLTDISIAYSSPLVKGRLVWGELVPFGEVWRAGANENTVITFSTPVTIDGKNISAGTYGLHIIPRKDLWTVIFSKNSNSWGSYFYNPAEDALRIEVKPQVATIQEWLSYRFTDVKAASAKVVLNWEKIEVGFLVQVDLQQTVLASMKEELRGLSYYTWEGPAAAAEFCLKNKINLDEAMSWADHSISIKETFVNLNTKAGLLLLKGDDAGAQQLRTKAVSVADEQQINAYGYQLLATDKKKEAIDIFKINMKRYPDSWNVYDSLGDAYEQNGNLKDALSNYKIAVSKAPDAQKKRISTLIEKIQKKI